MRLLDHIEIDGGFGEGGGQIIRSSVSLSAITGKPIKIKNIRKNRSTPGLRPQHLTAINILTKLCDGELRGGVVGSEEISFYPKRVIDSKIVADVGTAGSIPLILQVLIPVVSISGNTLEMKIRGGTDVRWSPTLDYTRFVLSDAYRRFGINFEMKVKRRGFYPKGGGIVDVKVFPANLLPICLLKSQTNLVNILCTLSNFPKKIGKEIVHNISEEMKLEGHDVNSEIRIEPALGSGGSLLIYKHDQSSIIGVDSLLGKSTSHLDILKKFSSYNLGTDDNLADMLVVPASMANGISVYTVNNISRHLETNLYVTSKITGCKYGVGKIKNGYEIRIEGISKT